MGLSERVWSAWQALTEVEATSRDQGAGDLTVRKTAPLPSILTQYPRLGQPTVPKPTAANLRRFAEVPVARRAINVVKDRIASMDWQIRVRRGYEGSR